MLSVVERPGYHLSGRQVAVRLARFHHKSDIVAVGRILHLSVLGMVCSQEDSEGPIHQLGHDAGQVFRRVYVLHEIPLPHLHPTRVPTPVRSDLTQNGQKTQGLTFLYYVGPCFQPKTS